MNMKKTDVFSPKNRNGGSLTTEESVSSRVSNQRGHSLVAKRQFPKLQSRFRLPLPALPIAPLPVADIEEIPSI